MLDWQGEYGLCLRRHESHASRISGELFLRDGRDDRKHRRHRTQRITLHSFDIALADDRIQS